MRSSVPFPVLSEIFPTPCYGRLGLTVCVRGVSRLLCIGQHRAKRFSLGLVHLTFIQGAVEHGAQWRHASGHLEAIDEEARWLTETAS